MSSRYSKSILFLLVVSFIFLNAESQAPLQPSNINPVNGTVNYSTNTVTVTVTDPNGDPMTVKLYGRKKNCTSTAPNFSIIGLPDTQFYTEEVPGTNSAGGGNNGIFKAQTQWIADHRLDSNIAFVTQLGDCVQNGDSPPGADNQIEWKRADTAMKNIENPNVPTTDGIPYGICVGNHDISPTGSLTGTTAFYNQYFGTTRFTGRAYYGGRYGSTNNNNHYELFSSGGIDFIHISIEYFVDGTSSRLQAVLDWADALLKLYPNRKGIISTHNLLGTGNPANFQGPGQKIYDDLKDNSNLFLMIAGHVPGEGRRSDTYNGNTVYSLMADYQNGYSNGGNGYLRIMQFRPAENIMTVRTYSPYSNTSFTGAASQFSIPVNFLCPFALIGTNAGVASGTATTFTWPGLALSTDYEWYVTIDDGNGNVTTSPISAFTTWNGVAPTSTGSLRFTDTTYINLGNAPELKLTNFTLEAWVKIEDYGSTAQTGAGGLTKVVPIISKGRAEAEIPAVDVNYFLGYELGTNKLVADFEDNATSLNHPVTSTAKILPNTWTHVGASFDVATKTWRLFIGAATETTVLGGTFIPQSLSDVRTCIGATLNSTNVPLGSFNGRIDEVRIWNTALTSLNNNELTSGAGLVGRWGFGDGAGTTVANSIAGSANGTIVNTYEWVTGFNEPDPTTNACIRFNGKDDYVTFGVAPSLGATNYTLEGWINIAGPGTLLPTTGTGGLTNIYPIITKGRNEADASNLDMNYFLGVDNTYRLVTDFEDVPNGTNHTLTGTTVLPFNQWRHIAVTYDGSYLKLYLNGNLENTSALIGIAPQSASIQHAAVGSALNSTGVPSGFFNGKIDEVRIWNVALTQAQIQTNMNNEITVATPNLIGRWGFKENGDTVAATSSGSVIGLLRGINPFYSEPSIGAASWVSSGFVPTLVSATSTSSVVNPNSIEYGTTTITFTTTVTPNPGAGQVQFYIDGAAVGAPVNVAAASGIAILSSYTPALLNVGSHTLRGDFTGSGAFGASTGTNTSFTVTPAILTYVATGVSRAYGAANPVFTASVTGFKNGQTQATATTGTFTFSTTATAASSVGNYPITVGGLTANNGNYTFIQAAGNSSALIITAAFLTYTAYAASRIYGDADPAFTGTVTGFVNGETQATATTGTLTFATTATAASNVGTWPINGFGLTTNNSNYEFVQAVANSTSLTITKRPLDFSGARNFINANSTFLASQLTPGNVVNNDVITIGGSATVSSPNVGTYPSFVTNSLTTTNTNYQTTGGIVNVSIVTVAITNHKSLRFTDTSYVDLGNAASLHLTNFTVEAWIKIEGYASTTSSGATGSGGGQDGIVPIITKGRAEQELASVDVNYFLSYRLSDRKLVADFEDNATSKNHSVISAATIPMNTWTHVGASFDVGTQTWRLFIDNNSAEVFVIAGGPFTPQSLSDVNACIGSTLNSAGGIRQGFFNGRIDEVRIWNTALTSLDPGELSTTPANLVGRWSLDEGVGTVVANTVNTGPSGSLVRYSEWVSGFNVPDSTTDASIRFNGVHDYVSFGAAPTLNTTAFTLEGWIYREGTGASTSTGTGGVTAVPIISKGRAEQETPNNLNMNYFLGIDVNNKLVADFEEATGPNHPVTGNATIPSNAWTHVAVTYDPTTGVWNLYINGLLDKSMSVGGAISPVNNSTQHAAIGSALNSLGVADGFFAGKIDEVRIWNKVLTASELSINSSCSPTTTGLLGYWNFNENGNVTANNSVSGGVNGAIISTNISTHPTNGAPSWACNGFSGNFYRSKNATGSWATASDWETFNGSTWSVATKSPGYTDNVSILTGTIYTISGPVSCNNLTVNSGGKLYRNNSTNNYVSVYGHIVCDGTIGNGSIADGISFSIEGDSCSISGSGTFDCSRIKKSCGGHTTSKLTFNRDVNLRFNGTTLYNDVSGTFLKIIIPQGITVNCLGDGTANSGGNVSIDGINGADAGFNAGSLTVDGTLNLSGIGTATPTLYLTNNNANIAWPVSVIIGATGKITTGILNCVASGVAGHSFTIMSGGKLNVTGEPVSYTAPSTTNNSYILNSGSTIEYSKGGNQTVYTFGSVNYSNLFASTSGTKTILAPLGVTDTVKLTGTSILASGGNLTLLSSVAKTAHVAELPVDGSGVALATITGNVTVERYYPARRSWRLVTAPLSGAGSIYSTWQNGGLPATTAPGIGTYVTGTILGDATNGLDNGPQPNSSLKTGSALTEVTNTNSTLLSGTTGTADNKGFFMFVRGDRNPINFNTAFSNTTTLSSKGKLQTGTQTFSAVATPNAYTLIGNPYASPVDFAQLTKNDLIPGFYAWDPNLSTVGAYVFMEDIGSGNYGAIPTSPGGQTGIIQSSQAIFVKTFTGSSPSLTFTENAKSSANNLGIFRPMNPASLPSLRTNLSFYENTGDIVLADGNLARFDDSYSPGVDFLDALKFGNVNETFGILSGTTSLVLDCRPLLTKEDTIFFKLVRARQLKYQFEFIAANLGQDNLAGFLEDKFLHTATPVNLNSNTKVDFEVTSDAASAATDRFRIVFKPSAVFTNLTATVLNSDIGVEWTVASELNIKGYDVERSTDGVHFTKVAYNASSGNSATAVEYNWLDVSPALGHYYYRIRSISNNNVIGYSNTAKVYYRKSQPAITVYPNPVVGDNLILYLIKQPVGKYGLRLINDMGQVISIKQIQHMVPTSNQAIRFQYKITPGTYQLEVMKPDHTTTMIKVVY